MPEIVPIRRALISVSKKAGLLPFIRGLVAKGVEIISTGGTAAALRADGIPVIGIEDVTGFPEIMSGRVKTLHPKVHGGLLGVRDDADHAAAMRKHDIRPIDLVCVNLYPFEATVAKPGCTEAAAIENIDIGGPSMLRSAAKNFEWVTVITTPHQYERVLAEVSATGGVSRTLRRALACEAFTLTARYDAAITSYLSGSAAPVAFPHLLSMSFVKADNLRYGENPHQSAALYRRNTGHATGLPAGPSIAQAEQLHGKDLSYNNINDAAAALELALTLGRAFPNRVGCCVIKHTNPCGASVASNSLDAVVSALAGDPLAAYGGILATNAPLDDDAAARLCDKDVFLEVVVAPRFHASVLDRLRSRWANIRLLAVGEPLGAATHETEFRSIPGGLLVQDRDHTLVPAGGFVHAAGPKPSDTDVETARFLEGICRGLFSNAIVLGGAAPEGDNIIRMFGGGAGQMDRVASCELAIRKAGPLAKGSVAFSDAFFPFPDGPERLIEAGVRIIVHPGGSKRDPETFAVCNANGVTCLTTGVRHFRH